MDEVRIERPFYRKLICTAIKRALRAKGVDTKVSMKRLHGTTNEKGDLRISVDELCIDGLHINGDITLTEAQLLSLLNLGGD